jgi:hypothetical protein
MSADVDRAHAVRAIAVRHYGADSREAISAAEKLRDALDNDADDRAARRLASSAPRWGSERRARIIALIAGVLTGDDSEVVS